MRKNYKKNYRLWASWYDTRNKMNPSSMPLALFLFLIAIAAITGTIDHLVALEVQ